MRTYLKIKIKNLASEAKDIRKEERKFNIGARERKNIKRDISYGSSYVPNQGNGNRVELSQAQIIRLEKKLIRSQRMLDGRAFDVFKGLRNHRTNELRKEARSALIAYGFLKGHEYLQIENTPKKVDWVQVEYLIKKYSIDPIDEVLFRFKQWTPK